MPLHDQRFPGIGGGPVSADHGAGLREIMLDRAEAAQILEIVDVNAPIVDLVAALPQEIADHVLTRPFGATRRGNSDKIPRGRQLRVETGIDGIEDFLIVVARVHGVAFPVICGVAGTGSHRSNHTFPGSAGVLDRFQNRIRAHTLCSESSPLLEHWMPGNRNILFLIIGALVVVIGVLGYNLYQSKKEPEGLQINVGPNGLKIQNK
jgi:hypothetical protein